MALPILPSLSSVARRNVSKILWTYHLHPSVLSPWKEFRKEKVGRRLAESTDCVALSSGSIRFRTAGFTRQLPKRASGKIS